MLRRFRRNLSFANVCSLLALTIAMGTGGAYAANTVFSGDIADGEVRVQDLADDAVNTWKIRNGSIWARDIHQDVIPGNRIRDNSLTGADVDESTLTAVPNASNAATA